LNIAPVQTEDGRGICCAVCRVTALIPPGSVFTESMAAFVDEHRACAYASVPRARRPLDDMR
jgi:hypothetical protein